MQDDQPDDRAAQQQEAAPATPAAPDFQWLPASRAARMLLGAIAAGFLALVFSAYLHPNMVFDLANMVFCG